MVARLLRRWLDRRQRDLPQLTIDGLRSRVELLEDAFRPIVRMFPDQADLRTMIEDRNNLHRIKVGEYTPYELHHAAAALDHSQLPEGE